MERPEAGQGVGLDQGHVDGGGDTGGGAHWPFDEVDAGLQVEAEVDEVPLDALALVLLLLQDEHGVVEELLQLLVGVVDAELLEGVQLQVPNTGGGAGVRSQLVLSASSLGVSISYQGHD